MLAMTVNDNAQIRRPAAPWISDEPKMPGLISRAFRITESPGNTFACQPLHRIREQARMPASRSLSYFGELRGSSCLSMYSIPNGPVP